MEPDNRVLVTIGIHPTQAHLADRLDLERLGELLACPRVVGLGEVGLDYFRVSRYEDQRLQRLFLAAILDLAEERDLPLILHTRDGGDGRASSDCLGILRKGLSRWHRVHRHCFRGCVREMNDWIAAFPNVCFGFTATVLRDPTKQEEEAIHAMASHRILLESDAPYLPVPGSAEGFNHPWSILATATRIARIRGVPVASLLALTRANAKRFYHL